MEKAKKILLMDERFSNIITILSIKSPSIGTLSIMKTADSIMKASVCRNRKIFLCIYFAFSIHYIEPHHVSHKKNDKLVKCIPNRFLFQKIFFTINLTFYDHSNLWDRDLILLFILSVTYEE